MNEFNDWYDFVDVQMTEINALVLWFFDITMHWRVLNPYIKVFFNVCYPEGHYDPSRIRYKALHTYELVPGVSYESPLTINTK